ILFLYVKKDLPQRSTLFPYTTLFRSILITFWHNQRWNIGLFYNFSRGFTQIHFFSYRIGAWLHNNQVDIGGFADQFQGVNQFSRSEEHTSELQSRENLVCRLLLEKKK